MATVTAAIPVYIRNVKMFGIVCYVMFIFCNRTYYIPCDTKRAFCFYDLCQTKIFDINISFIHEFLSLKQIIVECFLLFLLKISKVERTTSNILEIYNFLFV